MTGACRIGILPSDDPGEAAAGGAECSATEE